MESFGCAVRYLNVDPYGVVDLDELEEAVKVPNTILVSIQHSNNETGCLQPICKISEIVKKHSIPLHTDASQSLGKVVVDVKQLGVDYLTIAGHKLYAPKGIGALFSKNKLPSLLQGGNQENGWYLFTLVCNAKTPQGGHLTQVSHSPDAMTSFRNHGEGKKTRPTFSRGQPAEKTAPHRVFPKTSRLSKFAKIDLFQ